MSNKTLTLTIVIPAYNEQSYLKACLDSIANQSLLPDEVIVVDNNSSDDSPAIAKSYPFVKLLREPRQHQSFAQKTGFDAATSDLLGRIDADCVLPADWVEKLKAHFMNNPQLAGITGSTLPYDMAVKGASSRVFGMYLTIASRLAGTRLLWGANCALRRSDWLKIKDKVMTRGDIWEDYDLSFCLAPYGSIQLVKDMDVGSSFRAVHKPLMVQTHYQLRAIRTFYLRTHIFTTTLALLVWLTMYFAFLLILLDRHIIAPLAQLISSDKKAPRVAPEVVSLETE